METSEQINEIATALAKAQAQIEGAAKDRTNPAFKSKYADLASVMDACKGPLTSNGLSVVQVAESDSGETVTVHTRLLHTSGQWLGGSLTMRPTKTDPQGIVSVITYMRRCSLAAMVGVCPVDDDGNAASAPPAAKAPARDAAVESAIASIKEGHSSADAYANWRSHIQGLSAEQRAAVYAALSGGMRDQIKAGKEKYEREANEKRESEYGEAS